MPNVPSQLPDDIDALKALVAQQTALVERLEAAKDAAEQKNARLDAKVLSLQEQLNLALARRYAASSEKLSPDQIYLFDEAEVDALDGTDDEADVDETVEVLAHTCKKHGRKPLPETLPRVEVNRFPKTSVTAPTTGRCWPRSTRSSLNSSISSRPGSG